MFQSYSRAASLITIAVILSVLAVMVVDYQIKMRIASRLVIDDLDKISVRLDFNVNRILSLLAGGSVTATSVEEDFSKEFSTSQMAKIVMKNIAQSMRYASIEKDEIISHRILNAQGIPLLEKVSESFPAHDPCLVSWVNQGMSSPQSILFASDNQHKVLFLCGKQHLSLGRYGQGTYLISKPLYDVNTVIDRIQQRKVGRVYLFGKNGAPLLVDAKYTSDISLPTTLTNVLQRDDIATQSSQFTYLQTLALLKDTLPSYDITLVYAASRIQLWVKILEISWALYLISFVFGFFVLWVLHKGIRTQFIRPAQQMVSYIHEQARDDPPGDVPSLWIPWFALIKDTFQENRRLLDSAQQHAHELEETVSQRTEEIRKEKEKVSKALESRSQFFANMSHEIRTPLNAVLGFAQIIKNDLKQDELKGHVQAILDSGQFLMVLLNDVLDLSKLEAGKFSLNNTYFDPSALFKDVTKAFHGRALEKGINMRCDFQSQMPDLLELDQTRFRQVLFNLLGNAIKFTDDGEIVLSIKCTNQMDHSLSMIVTVADTGIGIAKHAQEHIFVEYAQEGSTRQINGTGLGLSISRRLVELMGGEIKVNSALGQGTTFTVILNNVPYRNLNITPVAETSMVEETHEGMRSATLLLVDDVDINREIVKAYLTDYPFDFIEAGSGLEAIELAKKYQPDVVLLDLRMPEMTGHEAAHLLKNDSDTTDIPIVVVTTAVNEKDRMQMAPYVAGYVGKPINPEELVRALRPLLSLSGAEHQNSLKPDEVLADAEKLNDLVDWFAREGHRRARSIAESPIINEALVFAEQVIQQTSSAGVDVLVQAAERLKSRAASFDTAGVQNCVVELQELVLDLEKTLNAVSTE